jgi:hypothetical protein
MILESISLTLGIIVIVLAIPTLVLAIKFISKHLASRPGREDDNTTNAQDTNVTITVKNERGKPVDIVVPKHENYGEIVKEFTQAFMLMKK